MEKSKLISGNGNLFTPITTVASLRSDTQNAGDEDIIVRKSDNEPDMAILKTDIGVGEKVLEKEGNSLVHNT